MWANSRKSRKLSKMKCWSEVLWQQLQIRSYFIVLSPQSWGLMLRTQSAVWKQKYLGEIIVFHHSPRAVLRLLEPFLFLLKETQKKRSQWRALTSRPPIVFLNGETRAQKEGHIFTGQLAFRSALQSWHQCLCVETGKSYPAVIKATQ